MSDSNTHLHPNRDIHVSNIFMRYLQYLDINMYYIILPLIGLEFLPDLHWIKLSASFYFAGLAVASFSSAFLIHHLNFKKTTLLTIALFMTGCILAIISQHFVLVLISRTLSGFAVGLIPSLVRSRYHQMDRKHIHSTLMIQNSFTRWAPMLAMFLAACFAAWFHWKAVFVFLLAYAALMFFWTSKATFQPLKKHPLSPLTCYKKLLTNTAFVSWAFASGFLAASVTAMMFISVFILHFEWAVDIHQAGIWLALTYTSAAIVSSIGVYLTRYFNKRVFLILGFALMLGAPLLISTFSDHHHLSMLSLLSFIAMFLAGFSLASPLYITHAAKLSEKISAPAGFALTATAYNIANVIILVFAAHIHYYQGKALAIYLFGLLALSSICAGVSFLLAKKKH